MAVTHGHGNPAWTFDEVLLALELYLECDGTIPGPNDERVVALSKLLRALPYHSELSRKKSFRNPAGVAFKLQNLRQVMTGHGLGNVSKMDMHVVHEFGTNPQQTKGLAHLIRTGIEAHGEIDYKLDEDIVFYEGRVITEVHKKRERHPSLRKKVLKNARQNVGIRCEVCGLESNNSFSETMFEVHHVIPLAISDSFETKLKDLAILCANCHRLVHKGIAEKGKWLSIDEASALITEKLSV
jgi:5-methylcytosine-specific restriction enzyme A